MRTSHSDPITIYTIQPAVGFGRIGFSMCPGKIDTRAFPTAWQRDMAIDLDAIKQWGANLVVTLIEEHEFELLQVDALGRQVEKRHMQWLHLPIRDVWVPGEVFETLWQSHGECIRGQLRDGFNVLVHCRGGRGRAGMIAARLLAELGVESDAAIGLVRQARPEAIETRKQEDHVRAQRPIAEPQPDHSEAACRDRAIGAMLGLAVGDALGVTLEFTTRDSYEPLETIIGGGPFGLKPGQWSDDTAMALALATSLVEKGGFDPHDLMVRFYNWMAKGDYSCTGDCFDIGITTRKSLIRFRDSGDPYAGSKNPMNAGNGSLMRLAPVAIRYWRDRETLREVAARQSETTHGAAEAVDACVAYAEILADAIEGKSRSQVLRPRSTEFAGNIAEIMGGGWRGRRRETIRSSGYVAHSLEASLWCMGRSSNFAAAVLEAANLGDDADTTAAITGQLAGAFYGAAAIPQHLLQPLVWREKLATIAGQLFDHGR